MPSIEDRYELHEELGRGGFGTTRAATDRASGERVAIKRIDMGDVQDWKSLELFEREAQALRELDHPKIPHYIEFVPIEAEGVGYLVQGLAPGRSLLDRLGDGAIFDEDRSREILKQMLEVLSYLESCDVVHRDIKPANIVMGDDDSIFLVDFGSVRAISKAPGGSTVAGTFGYMAPEQLQGVATSSSDIYGLGMTLVHMLTGVSPDLLPKVRLKPDFSDHAKLSAAFRGTLDRMIEVIPEDRLSSSNAVQQALIGTSLASLREQAVREIARAKDAFEWYPDDALAHRRSTDGRDGKFAGVALLTLLVGAMLGVATLGQASFATAWPPFVGPLVLGVGILMLGAAIGRALGPK